MYSLVIDPGTPATLYAGTPSDGVFRSSNGGGSWSPVNTGLSVQYINALAIAPAALYAATGGGVFGTLDGGDSWQPTGLGQITCGDGIAACELCDDGNTSNEDACRNDCGPNVCGDGFRNPAAEQCDDGNRDDADGCTSACTVCGDGVVTTPEECDDGNRSNNDTCRNDCRPNVCGDGFRNPAAEQGDDGNRDPFDGCTNDCIACGNGVVTPPEQCDSSAGCDTQCRWQHVVGNGTPESCTEARFAAALAERSVIFDCGPDPVTITLTSEKVITADTTIDGEGRVTLSGVGFTVDRDAGLEVRGLTMMGGISNNGGTLTLKNSTVSGNSYIMNWGTATLTSCTVSRVSNWGAATLTNCTVRGDSAGSDGVFIGGGTATLTNCTVRGRISGPPLVGPVRVATGEAAR